VLILWTLVREARLIDHHPLEYEMEKFDKLPGIYYENMGKVTLYSTDWKTVVYLPLCTDTDQLATIDSYVSYIEQLCSRTGLRSWTACNHLYELTSARLRQTRETERLTTSIFGRNNEENRRKRGLFDFFLARSVRFFLGQWMRITPSITMTR
jgi:hypothetical protein